jgi:hypothetical protein
MRRVGCQPAREWNRDGRTGTSAAQRLLVYGLALGSLSACGLTGAQKDAITQFSRASTTLGETVSSEMVDARRTVVELNMRVLALDPSRLRNRDQLEGSFSSQNVGARVQAAKVVETYGDLLRAIVEDTQENDLKAASTKFTQSIRGLDANTQRLSDAQLDGIGQVVAAIGGLWVEHKKAQALKAIIPSADAQIQEIGRLFLGEFEPGTGAVARNFEATGQLAIRASDTILDKTTSGLDERTQAAAAHRAGIEASRKANAVFPLLKETAVQMGRAHAQLVKTLAEDRISVGDIQGFVKEVQKLVAAVRIFVGK